jgi:hypothetical protein
MIRSEVLLSQIALFRGSRDAWEKGMMIIRILIVLFALNVVGSPVCAQGLSKEDIDELAGADPSHMIVLTKPFDEMVRDANDAFTEAKQATRREDWPRAARAAGLAYERYTKLSMADECFTPLRDLSLTLARSANFHLDIIGAKRPTLPNE